MLGRIIFTILLFLAIFIEVTVLPFPLFVLAAVLFFLFFEDLLSLSIIFLSSLFLDRLLIHTLGTTAVFLFLYFCVLVMLEKILTLKINAWIGVITVIIGVELYRQFVGYPFLWELQIIMVVALLMLVSIEKRIGSKKGATYAS